VKTEIRRGRTGTPNEVPSTFPQRGFPTRPVPNAGPIPDGALISVNPSDHKAFIKEPAQIMPLNLFVNPKEASSCALLDLEI